MRALRGCRPVVLAMVLAACGREEPAGPVLPPGGEEPAIVLSAPIPRSALGDDAPGTVVFVSAVPGSFARGERALLGLKTTGASSAVPVAGGGFDATALVAEAGDEVLVTIIDSAGTRSTETATARAPAPPRVVRTSPAPRRTDVPLNIVISVAFSAPMDTASVSAALRLSRSGAVVPGTVVFDMQDRTVARLVPAATLEPASEYVVELAGTARDVLGQAVEAGILTTFSTSASSDAPPVQSVSVGAAATIQLDAGYSYSLTATACTHFSTPCAEVVAPISWRSTAAGVASVVAIGGPEVPAQASVTARSPGRAFIIASAGGVQDSIAVFVNARLSEAPPSSLSANEIVFARTNLYAIRADGTGLRQLTTGGHQSEPSVAADGRIAFVESPGADPYARRLGIREVDGSVRYLSVPPPRTWWPPRCPAWSPDMRYIAYLDAAPYYDTGLLRVVHADSTTVADAAFTAGLQTCPKWTHDVYVAFGEVAENDIYDGPFWADTRMAVWSPGESGLIGPIWGDGSQLPGQWSPAGDEWVSLFHDLDERAFWITRLKADGLWRQRLWPSTGINVPEIAAPAWSPDGTLVAFGTDRGRVWIVDASNGSNRWWGAELTEGSAPTFVPPGVSFTR